MTEPTTTPAEPPLAIRQATARILANPGLQPAFQAFERDIRGVTTSIGTTGIISGGGLAHEPAVAAYSRALKNFTTAIDQSGVMNEVPEADRPKVYEGMFHALFSRAINPAPGPGGPGAVGQSKPQQQIGPGQPMRR